jgi:hypothetical protein
MYENALRKILKMTEEKARIGDGFAFEVYLVARNALEGGKANRFVGGYEITDQVEKYIAAGEWLDAVKQMRATHGLTLMGARDIIWSIRYGSDSSSDGVA